MAMGHWQTEQQQEFWIATEDLLQTPRHVFYERVNELLAEAGFDAWLERLCRPHYSQMGRGSIAPGRYFRMLMVGYFEDINSQRGIAWRCSDSLSLKSFLGCQPHEATPEHSSLTRITSRLPLEIYREVFAFVLQLVHEHGLLKGKTLGVDSTTLEANAAMKSIVRKDSGDDWEAHLKKLAAAEGIEISSRADAARFDKQRAKTGKKKCSNDDWQSPSDPEARITKMKDGSTHLAYKAENAVDLDTGAITAAEIYHADQADSATLEDTLTFATGQIAEVAGEPLCHEVVADKGYLKNETLPVINDIGTGLRTYISEPLVPQGRTWTDKPAEQRDAFRANHRRIRSERGKRLLRRRGEVVERTFAHLCETGGGRRTWLRGLTKVTKRYQVLALSHNLGLILRNLCGAAKPRAFTLVLSLGTLLRAALRTLKPMIHPQPAFPKFEITFAQTALAT
jgi:transposase